MSSDNYLTIHQEEGVVFDEVALHAALMKSPYVGELMDSYPSAPADAVFLKLDPKDGVLLYDREDGNYVKSTLVWGCWGDSDNKVVAKHLTAGKLVFKFEEEGHGDSYYVITPGKVEKPSLRF